MTVRVDPKSRPRSKKLYRRKGWKGFVHSYKNYIDNSSYDDVKWDEKLCEDKIVQKDDFKTIYKF
jgi:hypothetical protein